MLSSGRIRVHLTTFASWHSFISWLCLSAPQPTPNVARWQRLFCVSPELFPLMECSEEVKQLLLKLLWLLRPREAQSFARVSPTSPRHSASPYRVPKFNERTHSLIPNHCKGWRLGKIGQESICAIIIFFFTKENIMSLFRKFKKALKGETVIGHLTAFVRISPMSAWCDEWIDEN